MVKKFSFSEEQRGIFFSPWVATKLGHDCIFAYNMWCPFATSSATTAAALKQVCHVSFAELLLLVLHYVKFNENLRVGMKLN